MFSKSPYKLVIGRTVKNPDKRFALTDRQELVPGFKQESLARASAAVIGCGGLGSNIAYGLVRKGIGKLMLMDRDVVDPTNLTRTHFFERDVFKNKAERLARNLAEHSTCGTRFEAYPLHFQDALANGVAFPVNAAFVLVDNRRARNEASAYFGARNIPVIFSSVDLAAEHGYVFVQEPGKTCFRCAFPKAIGELKLPCRAPACLDILQVVAGIAGYAFDSLIMDRRRSWNFRNVHLAGFAPGGEELLPCNPQCELCSSYARIDAQC